VTDEAEGESNEAELLDRAAEEGPGRRGLTPRERKFIDALLGPANGDHRVAAKIVGLDETTGNAIIQRPRVQKEIARQMEFAKQRTGIDLNKDRLLLDLDYALREVRAAYSKQVTAYGACPGCGRRVSVTVRAGPKEIASLAIATSKTVEAAARITGAFAPTKVEHAGKTPVQDTYATLVRLVRDNVKAIQPAQREEMIAAALRDRADIDELLKLLHAAEVAH
jgi:hypothetical protein